MSKGNKSGKSNKSAGDAASAGAATAAGRMDDERVATALQARPEWTDSGGAIQRTWTFANFVEAMAFVNKVAAAAEAAQHHPDILVRYNKVTMTLSTHDAGGITQRDFDLAAVMDSM